MDNKIAVLFSGGWESTYCLLHAIEHYPKTDIFCVYYDYGQSFLTEELNSATRLCKQLDVKLIVMRIDPLPICSDGVYRGRNTIFIVEAFKAVKGVTTMYLGSRGLFQSWDLYGDSNWSYGKCLGKALGIEMRMPCTLGLKNDIKKRVHEHGIEDADIYSTEDM